MPTQFNLPVLDQKDYAKLFSELRQSIPKYSSNWTDFNDSDPGITILQLLAWLGDATLYRIDLVPRELYLNYARLVLGAGYSETEQLIQDLADDTLVDEEGRTLYFGDNPIVLDPSRLEFAMAVYKAERDDSVTSETLRRACLRYLQTPYRAVLDTDFISILMAMTANFTAEDNPYQKLQKVVPQSLGDFMRIVLLPVWSPTFTVTTTPASKATQSQKAQPPMVTATLETGPMPLANVDMDELVFAAVEYLRPRLILGTPTLVVGVGYMPLSITGRLALLPSANPMTVFADLIAQIQAWIDPATGGPDGTGWPVGRLFMTHDLVRPLTQVEGIDHSQPLQIQVKDFIATEVGASRLGYTTPMAVDPDYAIPILAYVNLEATSSTWPIQLGVHARVGIDTALPFTGGPG